MFVKRVDVEGFRNLHSQEVTPNRRINIIYGENAQGKTNFLEAIYLLASLRSFRAQRTAEMISFGQENARISALVEAGDMEYELELHLSAAGKRVFVDGKALRSFSSYIGRLNAVLFTPDDLQIPRGSPSARRKLIDRAITTAWPTYLSIARDYQKVLQTRNRVLRQRSGKIQQLLEVYDLQLAELGARMIASRVRYIRALSEQFMEVFRQIAQTGAKGQLAYQSKPNIMAAGCDIEMLKKELSLLLRQTRSLDMVRQTTTRGPHTDDVEFLLDGHPIKSFASQGQVRSMVLAFKISQIIYTKTKMGDYPALLLDDVSSELDSKRNQYLFDFINEIPCQIFITTTQEKLITYTEKSKYFQVVNGCFSS